MNAEFPSIWCEIFRENEKNFLMCGFYREWSHEGIKSNSIQLEGIRAFCSQIEKVNAKNKNIIIQEDANLCSTKWCEADFNLSYIADELLSTLALRGIEYKSSK